MGRQAQRTAKGCRHGEQGRPPDLRTSGSPCRSSTGSAYPTDLRFSVLRLHRVYRLGWSGACIGNGDVALITNPTATAVIGCALRVHTAVGPGLFESVYEQCLAHELRKDGLAFRRQVTLPFT